MSLITLDELLRGGILVTFGGAAGVAAMVAPGTLLWTLPAALGIVAGAATVPEVREEVARALPALSDARQRLQFAAPDAAHLARPQATPAPSGPVRQRPQAARQGAEAAPLPPAAWLRSVNDQPDRAPHTLVTGPTGVGKTTFVSAALGQRPGRTVVITPKVTPGAWRGAEVVTLGDDLSYEPLAAAIDALQTEAKRRAVALRRGEPLEPLTVVLDELPELVAEIPAAGPFAVRLSRWGRELGMRQVVLATSDEALNVKGWAATRANYVHAHLDRPAEDGTRGAWLDDGQERRPLDLRTVREGAERAQLRPWRGEAEAPRPAIVTPPPAAAPVEPADPQIAADALADLAAMLAAPVSSASQSVDTGRGVSVSATTAPDTDTDTGGVSTTTATLDTGSGGPTVRVEVHARAEAAPTPTAPERQRLDPQGRRRAGLDARRRRQLAEARKVEQRKAELRTAYAARKAEGVSYRKAYAELGGASDEARAWWAAAPAPTTKPGRNVEDA